MLPLTELLTLDGAPQALSTTRASFGALRALFAAHGLPLTRRAWLRSEIEELCAGKLDLSQVHGRIGALATGGSTVCEIVLARTKFGPPVGPNRAVRGRSEFRAL